MERDFKKLAHAIVKAHNSNIWSTQVGRLETKGRGADYKEDSCFLRGFILFPFR